MGFCFWWDLWFWVFVCNICVFLWIFDVCSVCCFCIVIRIVRLARRLSFWFLDSFRAWFVFWMCCVYCFWNCLDSLLWSVWFFFLMFVFCLVLFVFLKVFVILTDSSFICRNRRWCRCEMLKLLCVVCVFLKMVLCFVVFFCLIVVWCCENLLCLFCVWFDWVFVVFVVDVFVLVVCFFLICKMFGNFVWMCCCLFYCCVMCCVCWIVCWCCWNCWCLWRCLWYWCWCYDIVYVLFFDEWWMKKMFVEMCVDGLLCVGFEWLG